jgi:hypothetical protein
MKKAEFESSAIVSEHRCTNTQEQAVEDRLEIPGSLRGSKTCLIAAHDDTLWGEVISESEGSKMNRPGPPESCVYEVHYTPHQFQFHCALDWAAGYQGEGVEEGEGGEGEED